MEEINIRLDAFEGPLDLLYHLIEKNEIDIYDIPIAQVLEQYMEAIQQMKDYNMDVATEFLEMAARMAYARIRGFLMSGNSIRRPHGV